MKPRDIVTLTTMALGLAGLAAIGAIAYWIDAQSFRSRGKAFATQFPDRVKMLRDDLLSEEGIAPTEIPTDEA